MLQAQTIGISQLSNISANLLQFFSDNLKLNNKNCIQLLNVEHHYECWVINVMSREQRHNEQVTASRSSGMGCCAIHLD